MRSGVLLILTMLALVGGPNGSLAQNATVDVGIVNTGTQTFHGDVTIGLMPDQVRQAMVDVLQKDSLNAQRAAELDREVEQLSTEIGVRKPALSCCSQAGQTGRATGDPVGLSRGSRAFQGGRGAGAGERGPWCWRIT